MKKTETKLIKPFYNFLRLTLAKGITHANQVTFVGQEKLQELAPPYVVLANHTHLWDPIFIAAGVPEPVHFVTSDEQFRKPILRHLLPYVGAIPKVKFFSDAQTVKTILKIKKRNGVIGIFPEGARSWDGTTLDILFPTAKLIKSLKLPLVTAVLKGAALARPRWATHSRHGQITVEFEVRLTAEEVMALSVEEIYQEIVQGLAHDEYQRQEQQTRPYTGKRLAERIERFLFICPHCHKIGTLQSEDDLLTCKLCNYQTRYTEYGYFEPQSDQLYFSNPKEWNQWQLSKLTAEIDQATPEDCLFFDRHVEIFRGTKANPLEKLAHGTLRLYQDQIELIGSQGEIFSFPMEEIQGANIQHNQLFEFYHQRTLYRFVFRSTHASAYKWTIGVRLLQKMNIRREII